MQVYSSDARRSDPHSLPDGEVFQLTAMEVAETMEDEIYEYLKRFPLANFNSRDREKLLSAMVDEMGIEGGYFYWFCFPGCLPDSDPIGPYKTAQEAIAAFREEAADWATEDEIFRTEQAVERGQLDWSEGTR